MTYLLIILFLFFHYGRAQQALFPAAIPLAVRSPYLSCWDQTTNGTNLGTQWSTTSDQGRVRCFPFREAAKVNVSQVLGWTVLVRVDESTYSFLGDAPGGSAIMNGTVNVTDTVITPTQTVVAAQAGPMQINLTFLNPIEVLNPLLTLLMISADAFLLSPETGSSSQSRSHTWPYLHNRWTVQLMMCRCIRTSAEVHGFNLRVHTIF